jgi:tetratricopeptide (TPR) repeat protein
MPAPLTIVQVASLGTIGDNIYRVHEPAAALAQLPGVHMFEVHAQSRHRDAAALAADVLVLTMTLDVEVFRLIHQRRLLGKPTICEVNDYLPDVQPSNPAHHTWSDPRGQYLFEQLIVRSDAVQVSSAALGQRVAGLTQHLAVFDNQLASLPAPRHWPDPAPSGAPLVLGWGGSLGHWQDLQHIAPALIAWLQRHPQARLEIMADPSMAALFEGVAPGQFQYRLPGSLAHYLQWLATLDIGLAPLLPTPYNQCRSDVKFMEYAAHGVVPVLQRLAPYARVRDGETGFLFDNPTHLLTILDTLAGAPALRQRVATAAHGYLHSQRRIEQHAHQRLDFYRQQLDRVQARQMATPSASAIAPQLASAAAVALLSLPGWQTLGPKHHRLDLVHPGEHHSAAGVAALQTNNLAQAGVEFSAAARLDPSDATAYSWLGHCLLRQGRTGLARQALERAMALDPLLSRPVRALARLHRSVAHQYTQRAAQLNPLPARNGAPIQLSPRTAPAATQI